MKNEALARILALREEAGNDGFQPVWITFVTFVCKPKRPGRQRAIVLAAMVLVLCARAAAQIPENPPQPATWAPQAPSTHDGPPLIGGPGTALYQKLASAGLDPKAVYSVRDASLDREDLHITLEDGVIGFLESVDGRVTGA